MVYVIKSVWNAKGLTTKLSILFKGPGWTPGSQRRLGDPISVPEVNNILTYGMHILYCILQIPENIIPYDKNVPGWVDLYSITHFGLVIAMSQILSMRANVSYTHLLIIIIIMNYNYIVGYSLSNVIVFGNIYYIMSH